MNAYSLNGVLLNFYLMHLIIAMNINKMGVRISEGSDKGFGLVRVHCMNRVYA